jgi:hypothetical protein
VTQATAVIVTTEVPGTGADWLTVVVSAVVTLMGLMVSVLMIPAVIASAFRCNKG